LDFCTTNTGDRSSATSANSTKRHLHQPEALPNSQKRSKSFTIDAILGLEEFAASCFESADPVKFFSSQGIIQHYIRSMSYYARFIFLDKPEMILIR
jgi:hypothetical protein